MASEKEKTQTVNADQPVEERDGRRRRRATSRRAITDAMVKLIGDGVFEPTAAQVSEVANVGMRTVFRHFKDMESLFAETRLVLVGRVQVYFDFVSDAETVEERLTALIDNRADLCEIISNFKLAERTWLHRSKFLRQDDMQVRKTLRRNMKQNLPEAQALDPETLAALDMALGIDCWLSLRHGAGLSVAQAKKAVYALAAPLILPD